MFKLMEVPVRLIPQTPLDVVWRDVAEHWTLNQGPFALVILENAFAPCSLEESDEQHPVRTAPYEGKCRIALDPDAILATIRRSASTRDALISTTGYTSRALYALADDPSHFYMIGSMGCASSLALGVSLAQPTRRVITIDGDGAALMRLGAMAALGHYRPANLVHILLDNGLHESTGGQSTVAKTVNFLEVAAAVNYARVVSIEELAHLEEVLAQQSEGLTFIYVRSARRHSRELPRPRHSPPFFAERFSQWLQTTS